MMHCHCRLELFLFPRSWKQLPSVNPLFKQSRIFPISNGLYFLKVTFQEVDSVVMEWDMQKESDLEKPLSSTYYLPIHVVYKRSSTITKVCAVFDASAKSQSGVSLN